MKNILVPALIALLLGGCSGSSDEVSNGDLMDTIKTNKVETDNQIFQLTNQVAGLTNNQAAMGQQMDNFRTALGQQNTRLANMETNAQLTADRLQELGNQFTSCRDNPSDPSGGTSGGATAADSIRQGVDTIDAVTEGVEALGRLFEATDRIRGRDVPDRANETLAPPTLSPPPSDPSGAASDKERLQCQLEDAIGSIERLRNYRVRWGSPPSAYGRHYVWRQFNPSYGTYGCRYLIPRSGSPKIVYAQLYRISSGYGGLGYNNAFGNVPLLVNRNDQVNGYPRYYNYSRWGT